MNLVFVGCEYTGKSTLAAEVMKWAEETLGGTSHFHDHFSIPWMHRNAAFFCMVEGPKQC